MIKSKNVISFLSFSNLLLNLTLPTPSIAQSRLYTMADLLALENEKNTTEFFLHYRDIRPSERKTQWQEITINMGTIWIEELIAKRQLTQSTFSSIEERGQSFPFASNELFQFAKRRYLTIYFDECFKKSANNCTEDLSKSLSSTQLESEWSYNLINKHLSQLSTAQLQVLNGNILKSSDALIFCNKKDFIPALIRQSIEEKAKENPVSQNLSSNLSSACKLKLKPHLTNYLISGPRDKKLDTYLLLEEIKSITNEDRELFYISYVLDNAEVGETLNLAWNFIQSLGENYSKRQEILKQLQKRDKLPGGIILKDPNQEKHLAILNLFNKNFPEYIDLYATSCLGLLKGENTRTQVSHCHEFFGYTDLSAKWKESYYKLKKQIEGSKIPNKL